MTTEPVNMTVHQDDEMMKFIKQKKLPESHYFKMGEQHSKTFIESIKKSNPTFLSGKRVLDYGCGHGRITRHLKTFLHPSKLVVADVWDSAVNFCSKEFKATAFLISDENKISNYNEKFDLIISYSVFSHLPPNLFELTLSELKNILDSEGLLLFTTKGDFHIKRLGLSLENGYHYGSLGKNPNHTEGRLSEKDYSMMIVNKFFVENMLDKVGLELLEHIQDPEKLSSQEMYVVRKKQS
ncbi:MAG TPA: class I SAM-dependent methyltransferase [Candidatus Paceibacterota bacterium]|nr:class I SAM-dependent methyltransferase [Candidatus Paceibacterota bacterium]